MVTAKVKRKKEAKALLEGFWGNVFNFNNPKPLKIGIGMTLFSFTTKSCLQARFFSENPGRFRVFKTSLRRRLKNRVEQDVGFENTVENDLQDYHIDLVISSPLSQILQCLLA